MVVWRNDDGVTHRIVANDGPFDTGNLLAGATSSMVQPPAGGLNYHCSIHPTTMFGSISSDDGGEPSPCMDYCE
jgi:plastocyanin